MLPLCGCFVTFYILIASWSTSGTSQLASMLEWLRCWSLNPWSATEQTGLPSRQQIVKHLWDKGDFSTASSCLNAAKLDKLYFLPLVTSMLIVLLQRGCATFLAIIFHSGNYYIVCDHRWDFWLLSQLCSLFVLCFCLDICCWEQWPFFILT